MSSEDNKQKDGGFGNAFSSVSSGWGGFGKKIMQQTEALQSQIKNATEDMNKNSSGDAANVDGGGTAAQNGTSDSSSNGTSTTKTTAAPAKEVKDYSRDELLEVLAKMNTRTKKINAARLADRNKLVQTEEQHSQLLTLMKEEILMGTDLEDVTRDIEEKRKEAGSKDDSPIGNIAVLREAWRKSDEQKSFMLQQLQNEYRIMAMKTETEVQKVEERAAENLKILRETLEADAESRIEEARVNDATPSPQSSNDGIAAADFQLVQEECKEQLQIIENLQIEKSECEDEIERLKVQSINHDAAHQTEAQMSLIQLKEDFGKMAQELHDSKSLNAAEIKRVRTETESAVSSLFMSQMEEAATAAKEQYTQAMEEATIKHATELKDKKAIADAQAESKAEAAIHEFKLQLDSVRQELSISKSLAAEEIQRATNINTNQNEAALDRARQETEATLSTAYKIQMEMAADAASVERESALKEAAAKHKDEIDSVMIKAKKAVSVAKARMEEVALAKKRIKAIEEASTVAASEHDETLKNVLENHATVLKETKLMAKETSKAAVENVVLPMREELEKLKQELDETKSAAADELHRVTSADTEKNITEIKRVRTETEEQISALYKAQIEQVTATEVAKNETILSEIKEKHQAELALAIAKSEQSLEENSQEVEARWMAKNASVIEQHELEVAEVRKDFEKLKNDANASTADLEEEKKEILASANEEVLKLKGIIESEKGRLSKVEEQLDSMKVHHEDRIEEINNVTSLNLCKTIKELKAANLIENKEQIEDLETAHTSQIKEIKEELTAEYEQQVIITKDGSESLMKSTVDLLKKEMEQSRKHAEELLNAQVDGAKKHSSDISSELRRTKDELSDALSDIEEINAKGAAAAADAAAIASAASNDESKSQQTLQNALNDQRNSYEVMMNKKDNEHDAYTKLLNERLDSSEKMHEEQLGVAQTLEKEIIELRKFAELDVEHQQLRSEYDNLKILHQNMTLQLSDLSRSHSQERKDLEEKISRHDESLENSKSLQLQNEGIISELREESRSKVSQIEASTSASQAAAQNHANLDANHQKLKSEYDNLTLMHEKLTSQFDKLSDSQMEQKKESEQKVASVERVLEESKSLQLQKDGVVSQLRHNLDAKICQMKSTLAASEVLIQKHADLEAKHQIITSECNNLKVTNEQITSQFGDLSKTHTEHQKEWENKISSQEAMIDKLNESKQQAQVDKAELEKVHLHNEDTISNLTSRINSQIEVSEQQKLQHAELSREYDNIKQTNEQLSSQLEVASQAQTNHVKELEDKLAVGEVEMARMKQNHEDTNNACGSQIEQVRSEQQKIIAKIKEDCGESFKEKTRELEDASCKISDLESELSTRKHDAGKLINELENLCAKVEKEKELFSELKSQLHDATLKIDDLESKLSLEKAATTKSTGELTMEMGNLRRELEQEKKLASSKIGNLESELSAEKDNSALVNDLNSQLESNKEAYRKNVELLQSQVAISKQSLAESLEKATQLHQMNEVSKEDNKMSLDQRLNAVEDGHRATVDELKSANDAAVTELTKLLEDTKKTHEFRISDMEETKVAEKIAFEKELSTLKESITDVMARLQKERISHEEKVELNKKGYEAEKKSTILKIKKAYEGKFKSTMEENINRWNSEKESALDEAKRGFEAQKDSLNVSNAADIRDVEKSQKAQRSEIEKKLNDLKGQYVKDTSRLKQDKQAFVESLKQAHEKSCRIIRDEHSNAMAKKQDENEKRSKDNSRLVENLSLAQASYSSLNKDKAELQTKINQLLFKEKDLKNIVTKLEHGLQESVGTSSAATASLLQEQEQLQKQSVELRKQVEFYKKEAGDSKNNSEELTGKLRALSSNLDALAEKGDEQDKMLQIATKQEEKLNSTEAGLIALRNERNSLKLEQAKSNGLVARLQAEKDASERKHGQRTALVGMLEEQVTENKKAADELKGKLNAAMQETLDKEALYEETKDALEKSEKSLLDLKKDGDLSADTGEKQSKMLKALQKEIQMLQQQMARKSSAAQKLLKAREAECLELRSASKTLRQEVDKGSLSDRRIFELAAKQSSRESVAASEIEMRDQIMQRMIEEMSNCDGALASVEHNAQQVESQVAELCRVQRREDVNLDYLKSLIVQYLSKPPGSSERAALLPVIATLLQFDSNDYRAIEEGKQKVSWMWGQVLPTAIAAPGDAIAATSSAAGMAFGALSVVQKTIESTISNSSQKDQQHESDSLLLTSVGETKVTSAVPETRVPSGRSGPRTSLQF